MKYEVQESEETRGAFSVTAIGREGEIYSMYFPGQKRKNGQKNTLPGKIAK